jgi:peptidyl-tRNA hydrolase
MYIAVLDEAPDYMVPTLVAHSAINAHIHFTSPLGQDDDFFMYHQWLDYSFRKVVVRVNRKEYDKIKETLVHWEGHENTICDGKGSCLVVLPLKQEAVPNVLKFAKLWAPKEVV